ncbi:hypothetical protein LCGC14_1551120 [marine sediment metagenome]|uniref:Uncharacterized protein n=1 Tax=marine sediment metagenome TaxID=412755 RepID=A0A0F9IQ80_9ZZZZ
MADENVNPTDAMKKAMGAEEAEAPKYDLAAAVANAQPGGGYNGAAEYVAKMIMRAARRDPQAFAAAAEAYREDPYGHAIEDLMTAEERDSMNEITGFMWGWAVNAVFYLTEQPAGPNPGIITISG